MKKTVRRFPTRSKERSALTVVCSVIVATIIVFAFGIYVVAHAANGPSVTASYTDPRFASLTAGTTITSEVPAVLPAGGVTINKQIVLRPLTSSQQASWQQSSTKISASQAITIGRTYANAQPFAATTLLASVTEIGSVPPAGTTQSTHVVQNVPAWVVTFTTNNPQNVAHGRPGHPGNFPAKHFNIVIDAYTGAFVLGFFTL